MSKSENIELIPLKCEDCGKHKPVYLISRDGFADDGQYCKSCAEKRLEEED